MTTQNWISCAEAAELLDTSEEHVRRLIERRSVRGYKEGTKFFVDKDNLLDWKKRRDEPKVQVQEIYQGLRSVMLEHYNTIYAREQAQHSGIRGALYEQLLRDFLRDYLPQKFYIGSGQVLSSKTSTDADGLPYKLSRQIDIVIFDAFNHPILLPKYELFPIEGTLAVIEVKSNLNKSTLIEKRKKEGEPTPGALPNIGLAKGLLSQETNRMLCDDIHPPLGIVFAFESIRPRSVLDHWKEWNASKGPRYRTDMICLLKRRVLMVDTNRFPRLFDDHQIATCDPIAFARKKRRVAFEPEHDNVDIFDRFKYEPEKLIAFRTPDVLFWFLSLLLRELRKMSDSSQHLVTTPSSYIEEFKLECLACVGNP